MICPCGPTSGSRRRPSKFSPRMRSSHLGPPHCRTIFGGDSVCLLLTVQCWGKDRGTAPHPPGIVPGGRAGRGMVIGSWWQTRHRPRKRPLRAKDPGGPHVVAAYPKYRTIPAKLATILFQSCHAIFAGLLAQLPRGRRGLAKVHRRRGQRNAPPVVHLP